MSHKEVCRNAILDIYRPSMVGHVRRCFHHHFRDAPAAPIHKLLNTELSKRKQIDEKRVVTGVADRNLTPTDDFDLLDVSNFHNLFETHYNELTPQTSSGVLPSKRDLLAYLVSITDFRNRAVHQLYDFSFYDAIRCLDDVRRLLESLHLREAATQVAALLDQLHQGAATTVRGPLENNLPAPEKIVTDFVGRDVELTKLHEWLGGRASRRWVLCGAGGLGKSSLAYQFAREVVDQAPKPFDWVFWLTAKKRAFIEGVSVDNQKRDFSNLDEALNALALELGKPELFDLPLLDRRDAVLDLLNERSGLLVVDDIDSIEAQEADAIEFFSNDVPGARSTTKVLFTSRREIFGMQRSQTEVKGLEGEAAESFIRTRATQFRLPVKQLKPKVIRDIVRVTEGSPLYMEDLLRLAAFYEMEEAVRMWETAKGDQARRFALRREFEMLPDDAREILIAACIQPMAISGREVRTVLQLSDERFESAMKSLRGLFLMEKALIRGELRYEVNTNLRRLVQTTEKESDRYKRVQSAYAAHAGDLTSKGRGELRSVIRQASLASKQGESQRARDILMKAIEQHGRKPALLAELGAVYANWSPVRVVDAEELFKECIALHSASDDPFIKWCRMQLNIREYTKAGQVAEEGLKQHPHSFELMRLAGEAFGKLGDEQRKRSSSTEARKNFEKSTEYYWKAIEAKHPTNINDREADSEMFRAILHNLRVVGTFNQVRGVYSFWGQRHPNDGVMRSELERSLQQYAGDPEAREQILQFLKDFEDMAPDAEADAASAS